MKPKGIDVEAQTVTCRRRWDRGDIGEPKSRVQPPNYALLQAVSGILLFACFLPGHDDDAAVRVG